MRKFISLCILCSLFASCDWVYSLFDDQEVESRIEIKRYDKLLSEFGALNSFYTIQRMNTDYPRETKMLIEDVLGIGEVVDPDINDKLQTCLADSSMLLLMADGEAKFGNMKKLNGEFNKAFECLSKQIPGFRMPHIYAQFSALNQSVVVDDTIVGFSLDKYMGVDYPPYKKYFYDYQIRSMVPERIVPDCLFFYLFSEYPFPAKLQGTIIEHVVYYGKINWITMKAAHLKNVEEMFCYTPTQRKWLKQNGDKVYQYLENISVGHSTDPQLIRELLRPAAYTPTFGAGSPDLLGAWVGVRMVDKYMSKHPNVTMGQLLIDNNQSQILSDSGYNL